MKKINSFLALALISTAGTAFAEGMESTLKGRFKFEAANRAQSKLEEDAKFLTTSKKNPAFATFANLSAMFSNKVDNMEYGANLAVMTSAKPSGSSSYDGSYLFLEKECLGKFEFGSNFDAGSRMYVSGLSIARGSANDWVDYFGNQHSIPFATTLGASALEDNYYGNATETSRKVTYFSPKMMDKLQFGVSYIPDSDNVGSYSYSNRLDDSTQTYTLTNDTYTNRTSVKDAVSLGATFAHNVSDGMDVQFSATGEMGKAAKKGEKEIAGTKTEYKMSDLKSYTLGAALNVGPWSVAGSYTDMGKSLTSKEVQGSKNKTKVYTAAAAYANGPYGVSLLYTMGDKFKNKVDSYTIGTDYKLAPGFMPFVEVTYFKGKGYKLPIYNDTNKYTTKGTIALIGAQLNF